MDCSAIANMTESDVAEPFYVPEAHKELLSSPQKFILLLTLSQLVQCSTISRDPPSKPGLNLLFRVKFYPLNCVSKTRHLW
jgi:hypothetical protein